MNFDLKQKKFLSIYCLYSNIKILKMLILNYITDSFFYLKHFKLSHRCPVILSVGHRFAPPLKQYPSNRQSLNEPRAFPSGTLVFYYCLFIYLFILVFTMFLPCLPCFFTKNFKDFLVQTCLYLSLHVKGPPGCAHPCKIILQGKGHS